MRYYRVEVTVNSKKKIPTQRDRDVYYEYAESMQNKTENFFAKMNKECCVFSVETRPSNIMRFGAFISTNYDVNAVLKKFFSFCGYNVEYLSTEEITLKAFKSDLRLADSHSFIEDSDAMLRDFGLEEITERYHSYGFFNEYLALETGKDEIIKSAEENLFSDSFVPEIERIYTETKPVAAIGHPVHYLVRTRQNETRNELCSSLVSALYENGRIVNRRYACININPNIRDLSESTIKTIYKSSDGGAVIINFNLSERNDDDSSPYASINSAVITSVCNIAKKNRNSVLTIFCIKLDSVRTRDTFLQNLSSVPIVEITEDTVDYARAKKHLQMKAKNYNIKADKKLYKELVEGRCYHAEELDRMFDGWYSEKLHTAVYKQYKDVKTARAEVVKEAAKGNAAAQLREMIGLEKAKEVIENAVNFYKIQKLYAERGLSANRPSMHMIFTGNPGTAKTTVARLFAQIMKDNGLLTKGDLFEVGRSDLVGKYVGWTAPTVKSYFKQAKGSVLFIDEAYSLVDDRNDLYGDEAINTIVQEMENNRDDLVVIFAGYPDKMEEFLNKNPGLRSRIAFHVSFDDYSTEELMDIADLMIKKTGFEFSDDAHEELNEIFNEAIRIDDFGNGRYVRNLLELSTLRQASRLAKSDIDALTDDEMKTLTKEDIVAPLLKHEENRQAKIGF